MKMDYLLLRQVHPQFFTDGQLMSQAFSLFQKIRESCPSMTEGSFSPAQSFEHYTRQQGLESVGVWGITNTEVIDAGLTSKPDPLPDSQAHNPVNPRRLNHSIEQLKQGKVVVKAIEELERMEGM